MALPDLTGQNIQDTYQRLVQVDSTGSLVDGTGSNLPISIEGDNVRVTGDIIAQQYVVSSSVTNITTQQLSGSTKFGDSIDDTHQFTGSMEVSGTSHHFIVKGGGSGTDGKFVIAPATQNTSDSMIYLGGNVHIAQKIAQTQLGIPLSPGSSTGDLIVEGTAFFTQSRIYVSDIYHRDLAKSFITYNETSGMTVFGSHGSYALKNRNINFFPSIDKPVTIGTGGHITASGNISASGTITADIYKTEGGSLAFYGNNIGYDALHIGFNTDQRISIGKDATTDIQLNGNITASNNISASGQLTAERLSTNVIYSHDNNNQIDVSDQGIIGLSPSTNKDVVVNLAENGGTGFSVKDDGSNTTFRIDAQSGNITASGNISASGNIVADYYDAKTSGIGYKLSGVKLVYLDSSVPAYTFGRDAATRISGSTIELSGGHVTASGNISASGDGYFNNVTIADDLNVTDDIIVGNMSNIKVGSTAVVSFQATQALFQQNVKIQDNDKLLLGNSDATNPYENDMEMFHDGTDTHFKNNHGVLNISSSNGLLFKTDITASGHISASGRFIGNNITLGDTSIVTPSYDFHVRNAGSATVTLESWGNQNQIINFLNNQSNASGEPDFLIGNFHTNGGFQVRSDNKTFMTIGANNGDVVSISGSVSASGDISASGKLFISEGELYLGSNTRFIETTANNAAIQNSTGGALDTFQIKSDYISGAGWHINGNKFATGEITASGDISASGTIYANKIVTTGTDIELTNVSSPQITITDTTNNLSLILEQDNIRSYIRFDDNAANDLHFDSNASNNHLVLDSGNGNSGFGTQVYNHTSKVVVDGDIFASGSSGHITASGEVLFGTEGARQTHTFFGRIRTVGSEVVIGDGHVTASGNISASGDINAGSNGTGSFDHIVTSGQTIEFKDGTSKLATLKADSAGSITFGSDSSAKASIKVADVGASGGGHNIRLLNGDITASGQISASGQLDINGLLFTDGQRTLYNTGATLHVGDGIGSVTVPQLKVNTDITASGAISASAEGTSSFGQINTTGRITANNTIQSTRYQLNSGKLLATESNNELVIHGGEFDSTLFGKPSYTQRFMFHGDITASRNISASGGIYGTDFYSYNRNFMNYHAGDDIFRVSADGTPVKFFTSIEATNITASGAISASSISASIISLGNTAGDALATIRQGGAVGDNASNRSTIWDVKSGQNESPLIFRNAAGGPMDIRMESTAVTDNRYILIHMTASGGSGEENPFSIGLTKTEGTFDIWNGHPRDGNTTGTIGALNSSWRMDKYNNVTQVGHLNLTGSASHITASGDISSSGKMTAWTGSFHKLRGDQTYGTGLHVKGYVLANQITSSGTISASGNIMTSGYVQSLQGLYLGAHAYTYDNRRIFFGTPANAGDKNFTLIKQEAANELTFIRGNEQNPVLKLHLNQHTNHANKVHVGGDLTSSGYIHAGTSITASGNISASGNIYSDNIEILAQGSARISTITNTTDYWGPNYQGPYHTANWNKNLTPSLDEDGNHILIMDRQRANSGFIVPYSASLVGFDAIGGINSGEDTPFSMSLHTADALSGMNLNSTSNIAPGFTASLACTGISQGSTGFNRHRLTGSCEVPLSPFSVIFPNVMIDASGNDDSAMTLDITYVIKIKRIK